MRVSEAQLPDPDIEGKQRKHNKARFIAQPRSEETLTVQQIIYVCPPVKTSLDNQDMVHWPRPISLHLTMH